MKEHTPADTAALTALAMRASDVLDEFHRMPSAQWDRMDSLIEKLSAIVDEMKVLGNETRRETGWPDDVWQADVSDCEYPNCDREGKKRAVRNFGDRRTPELCAFLCDAHWNPRGACERTLLICSIIKARVAPRN